LTESLFTFSDNQTVVQAASFVIGEFATATAAASNCCSGLIAEARHDINTALTKLAASP
jgi:hypothetical protein